MAEVLEIGPTDEDPEANERASSTTSPTLQKP